jgi:integrase
MPRTKKQHLKRRKDGRYCCVYHGKQFMGLTEEEAFAKRDEYKWQEKQNALMMENPSVRQYAERWLPIGKTGVKDITKSAHKILLNHLYAVIGDTPIRDVKPTDIKRVYSVRFADKSQEYIAHARSLYKTLFTAAVEDGLLLTNPAAASSAQPHKGTSGGHRAITDNERWIIEHIATDHRMHAPAIVMLYAGLRPQEVKALRVEDVDFDAGIIHVRSTAHVEAGNRYIITNEGKTENAVRDVPLFAPVREVLQGKTGLLMSKGNEIATISAWQKAWKSYAHTIETYLNGMTKNHWVRLKDKLPWKSFDVVPYDLRHSFATWCRDNGVELNTCVHWMGHADAHMILRIYDTVSQERSKTEAEKLEKMLLSMRNDMQKETGQA